MTMTVHVCHGHTARPMTSSRLKRVVLATALSIAMVTGLAIGMGKADLKCTMSFSVSVPMTSMAITFQPHNIHAIRRTYIEHSQLLASVPRIPPKFIVPNGHFCKGKRPPTYLFYVYSAPHHFGRRQVIRKTWGQVDLFAHIHGKVAFIIGKSTNNSVQDGVNYESRLYGDMVIADFIDSYKNLTTKGIAALHWLDTYCRDVEFLLKADDDLMVDIFGLAQYLVEHVRHSKRSFHCRINHDGVVVRRGCWKWEVSRDEFPANVYPPYCDGPLWIVTRDIIPELARASLVARYLPIEDAFTSGILAMAIGGVRHVWLKGLETLFTNTKLVRYTDKTRPLPIASIPQSGIHHQTWGEIYCRWHNLPKRHNSSYYLALSDNLPIKCASVATMKARNSIELVFILTIMTVMIDNA